jgi:hypothetical protein
MPASNGNDESPTTNRHNNTHCFYCTTYCYNARLEVILGLAKRRENVGGWNEDDKNEVVDEMSEILVMSSDEQNAR